MAEEIRLNKNIELHPDRLSISKNLSDMGCNMLAYVVETGLNLSGWDLSQREYNKAVEDALSDD